MNTINGNMAKGFDNEKENKFDTNRLLIRDLLDIDKNGKIEGKEWNAISIKDLVDINKDGKIQDGELNSVLGVYLKLINRNTLSREEFDLFKREVENGEGLISMQLKKELIKKGYTYQKLIDEASKSLFVEWPKKRYLVKVSDKNYIDYFKTHVDMNGDHVLSDQELYEKMGITLKNGKKVHGMEYIQDLKRKLREINIKPNKRVIKNYEEILNEMEQMASKYPDKVKLETIGETAEGRKIVVLKISNNINKEGKKASILVQGLTHAREWATGIAALEVAKDILENPGSQLSKYLDKVDIYILPVLNPDGYEYSLNHDAWWRKNRRDNHGVDLNRNYYTDKDPTLYRLPDDSPEKVEDDKGASDDPSNIQYRGPYGNSEKEVQAVTKYVKDNNIDVVIDLHSFGNMILYPYPLEDKISKWDTIYKEVGEEINKELGGKFSVIKENELYFTTGGSSDYYDTNGVFSYTIELGRNFFVNNKKKLDRIVKDTNIIVKVLLENMVNGKIPTKLYKNNKSN